MTYEQMMRYYMDNGGQPFQGQATSSYTAGGDTGTSLNGGRSTEVFMPDGRRMAMMPGGQLMVSGNAVGNRGGYDNTLYDQNGQVIQQFWSPNNNLAQDSLRGLVTTAAMAAGATAVASYVGPMMEAWAGTAGLSPSASQAVTSTAAGDAGAYAAENGILNSTTWGSGPPASSGAMPGDAFLSQATPYSGNMLDPTSMAGGATPGVGYAGSGATPLTAGMAGASGGFGAGTAAAAGAPLVSNLGNGGQPGGAPGAANAPTGQQPQGSILDRLLNGGSLTAGDLANLLSGGIGAANRYNFGQALLDRAEAATPNREFYEGQLRGTYENPGSFLSSPEWKAIQDTTHNKLQRSDAAGGRLANDIGRQDTLNRTALTSLNDYRRTLGQTVAQNQATYSGQNSMFAQGQTANNTWTQPILQNLLGRSSGAPSGSTQPSNTSPYSTYDPYSPG